MSGLAIIVGDSAYAGANVGYSLPVSRGARTLLFPKVDAATTLANKVDALAGGVGNGSIFGTPIYAAGSVNLRSSSSYINTASADAGTTTILAVVRTSDGLINGLNTPAIGGNWTISVSGLHFGFDDNSGVKNIVARRTTTVSGSPANSGVLRTPYTLGAWAFVACVFENNVGMTIYNKTLGGWNFLAVTTQHVPGAGAIKAGSGFGTTYQGTADFAFWAEHNVALTTAEIDTYYEAIRARLAAYSSPIIV